MEEKKQLMHIKEIGYGLDILDFTLSPRDVILMRCLWDAQDNWVSTDKITKRTGLSADATVCRVMGWRRREDYGEGFAIKSQRSSGLGYRLITCEADLKELAS